jgi:hypothetical protein
MLDMTIEDFEKLKESAYQTYRMATIALDKKAITENKLAFRYLVSGDRFRRDGNDEVFTKRDGIIRGNAGTLSGTYVLDGSEIVTRVYR